MIDASTVNDRVFVCLGLQKDDTPTAWTMIISKDFSDVTMWEV